MLNCCFGFAGLGYFLYMWVSFDKKAEYQKIFMQDGIIYARNIFNAASWNTKDAEKMTQN